MNKRTLSLRVLLLGPLMLQVLLMIVAIALGGYRNGEEIANRLATTSQERASRQVHDYLDRFLRTPQQVIRLMADEVEQGRLDPNDRIAVAHTLWTLRQIFPDAAYLNYGWANGNFIGLGQVGNSSKEPFLEIASASSIQKLYQFRLNQQGQTVGLNAIKSFDDFRTDQWYSFPFRASKATWIPIYNWVDAPDVMVLGAGIPIRRFGAVIGVAEIDTFLANINGYLRHLPIAESGVVYIVESDGRLVADSTGHLPFSIVNGHAVRRRAQDSADPVVRASASALLRRHGSFQMLATSRQLELPLESGNALVRLDPYRDGIGLDWRIVVVIPEHDLYGSLRQEISRQLLISLIVILISAVSILMVVQFVTRQLDRLIISTDAIADGDLSQTVAIGSVQELARLALSFNEMTDRLRRSFATLRSRNREITRLAELRRTQLTSSEQQLNLEVQQRERLEQSLAEATRPSSSSRLVDPVTGLFSLEGLERRLCSKVSSDHDQLPVRSLLALQLALCSMQLAVTDQSLLQLVSDRLEQLVADHHGLAAYCGEGRFAVVLFNVNPDEVIQALDSLSVLLAPMQLFSGMVFSSEGGDGHAQLALLEEAGQALMRTMVDINLPSTD
jgi:HAMP domain-containing protein